MLQSVSTNKIMPCTGVVIINVNWDEVVRLTFIRELTWLNNTFSCRVSSTHIGAVLAVAIG